MKTTNLTEDFYKELNETISKMRQARDRNKLIVDRILEVHDVYHKKSKKHKKTNDA